MERQFQWSRTHPENGEEMTTAPGRQRSHIALARARSARENQCESRISVAGKTPLSEIPSRRRNTSIS